MQTLLHIKIRTKKAIYSPIFKLTSKMNNRLKKIHYPKKPMKNKKIACSTNLLIKMTIFSPLLPLLDLSSTLLNWKYFLKFRAIIIIKKLLEILKKKTSNKKILRIKISRPQIVMFISAPNAGLI